MKEVSELIFDLARPTLLHGSSFGVLWVFIRRRHRRLLRGSRRVGEHRLADPCFSIVGIAGSATVALRHPREHFANSRTAFASLRGKPYLVYAIPLKAGMSIGMLLISIELAFMLCILTLVPHEYAGKCFIGFAIGESLGAAALRVAGGIFTKSPTSAPI